jgi:glycosyltransferase involved in cell wall biosynthesis
MLVRASGPDPLSETLLRFLTEDSLRVKLSEGALRYSREFSWDRTAKEFMKLLDEFDGHSGSVMPSN